jgi:hypothetical protein
MMLAEIENRLQKAAEKRLTRMIKAIRMASKENGFIGKSEASLLASQLAK